METQNDKYATDFFQLNRWTLRCVALWKPENKNKFIQALYVFYRIAIFSFVNIYFTGTEILDLYLNFSNKYEFIKSMSVTLTHVLGGIKVIFFFLYGHEMARIMHALEDPKLHYECCPEKDFFPGKTSEYYRKSGRRYIISYLCVSSLGLLASFLPVLVLAIKYDKTDPDSYLPNYLPYRTWMPFKIDTNTGTYLLAVFYESIPLYYFVYSIIASDTLFMNIINSVIMHLKNIQGAFFSIRERSCKKIQGPSLTPDGLSNSNDLNSKMKEEMTKIIKHLQFVYQAAEDLETVHTYITLVQILSTLVILCSCLYLVTTTSPSDQLFLSEVIYMFAMGFQLTLYCMFGNEVTIEAQQVSYQIFKCDWLSADEDFKNLMLFTMVRSTRPLYFTVGKFVPLTLSTYVSVIKASYSFFAVLRNTSN